MVDKMLSIVIPSYNRCSLLEQTLKSILPQTTCLNPADVEVVVSDNASSDETCILCRTFQTDYPQTFRFLRQKATMPPSEHHVVAMEQARGEFVKLCNDTLLFRPGALKSMVDEVRRAKETRDLLWFSNDIKGVTQGFCRSVPELLHKISYFSTWIMPFGVWREDLPRVRDVFAGDTTLLPQTIFLLSEMSKSRPMRIIGGHWCDVQDVPKKGGYNVAEIFGRNYFNILKPYIRDGALTTNDLAYEKRRILRHINYQYFDWRRRFAFKRTGYLKFMFPIYGTCPYFYCAMAFRLALRCMGGVLFALRRLINRSKEMACPQ